MQTFLPYRDFGASARCLDRQRLGKQRVEVYQILRSLAGVTASWRNHPATQMWVGYEHALIRYGVAICDEWIGRGYNDTCREKILAMAIHWHVPIKPIDPPWIGDREFHRSHQSNLLRKDAEHYGKQDWDVPDNLEYHWPRS